MARWLAKLDAETADLEEYVRWFPSGEISVLQEGRDVYLAGAVFKAFTDAEQSICHPIFTQSQVFAWITGTFPGCVAASRALACIELQKSRNARQSAIGFTHFRATLRHLSS